MLPAALLSFSSCGSDGTPFEAYDEEGYTVSVKYDANGGFFGTSGNTSVIYDSFNPDSMKKNSEGMIDIPLLSPDNEARDRINTLVVSKEGYYFAGWYASKEKLADAEGKEIYEYSDEWNFDTENYGTASYSPDVLTIDPDKAYSAKEPVLTLYAAWLPELSISYYDLQSGELIETQSINPTKGTEITKPYWEEEGVTINMADFPQKNNHTFKAVYADKEGKEELEGESFSHSAVINESTFEVEGEREMSVYVEWSEGKEYRIYTAEQFKNNCSTGGNYTLYADLDFADTFWPDMLTTNEFTGTINGNGHTISNANIIYNSNDKTIFGLFGRLSETASITDLKLEGITATLNKGSRMAGASFGLFAGSINENAKIEKVEISSSSLIISSDIMFLNDNYSIGLVSGSGDGGIDFSDIECKVTEGTPSFTLQLEGNTVTLSEGNEYVNAEESDGENITEPEESAN